MAIEVLTLQGSLASRVRHLFPERLLSGGKCPVGLKTSDPESAIPTNASRPTRSNSCAPVLLPVGATGTGGFWSGIKMGACSQLFWER
ncbi:hypothetical protein K474DRAFT_1657723 [Panus rudis PR-1116 ss-1]|nr:hypothetical protein K474DRAFT_1657723 [Panus rudis PR-1116 ss-1]